MTALQCEFTFTVPLLVTMARKIRPATPSRRRYQDREEASLEQCERLLAEQRQRETPPIRRCEVCDGMELVASPHAHTKRDRITNHSDISVTPGRAA